MEVRSIETIVKALKKSAGHPQNLADIEKLHKLDPHRKQHDEKRIICPSGMGILHLRGAELHTLLLGLLSTFREKLEWQESAETLARILQAGRRPKKAAKPRRLSAQ